VTAGAFWISLLEIVGLNLVLSADNAVVIALATRALPRAAQRRAMAFGIAGAVLLRIVLTIAAVEALKLPYLKLAGAALLLWIGAKLLVHDDADAADTPSAATAWAAARTIVLADAMMSLDNVLALAAAAKGSIAALVAGLTLSIPVVVLAAAVLLRLMRRWPIVITVGAGVIGWVAGELALADPLAAEWRRGSTGVVAWLLPAAGAVTVIALGKALAARSAAAR